MHCNFKFEGNLNITKGCNGSATLEIPAKDTRCHAVAPGLFSFEVIVSRTGGRLCVIFAAESVQAVQISCPHFMRKRFSHMLRNLSVAIG